LPDLGLRQRRGVGERDRGQQDDDGAHAAVRGHGAGRLPRPPPPPRYLMTVGGVRRAILTEDRPRIGRSPPQPCAGSAFGGQSLVWGTWPRGNRAGEALIAIRPCRAFEYLFRIVAY
jgi:hypothetical protein